MRDRVLLLIAAGLLAAASWAFWHFLGEDAFTVFSTFILLSLVFDNLRLRRKLRYLERHLAGTMK